MSWQPVTYSGAKLYVWSVDTQASDCGNHSWGPWTKGAWECTRSCTNPGCTGFETKKPNENGSC